MSAFCSPTTLHNTRVFFLLPLTRTISVWYAVLLQKANFGHQAFFTEGLHQLPSKITGELFRSQFAIYIKRDTVVLLLDNPNQTLYYSYSPSGKALYFSCTLACTSLSVVSILQHNLLGFASGELYKYYNKKLYKKQKCKKYS